MMKNKPEEKPRQIYFRHAPAARFCHAKHIDPNKLARQLLEEWYRSAIKSEPMDKDGLISLAEEN